MKKILQNYKKGPFFPAKKGWRWEEGKVMKYWQALFLMLIKLPLYSSINHLFTEFWKSWLLTVLWHVGNSHALSDRETQTGVFLLLMLPMIFGNGRCEMLVWGLQGLGDGGSRGWGFGVEGRMPGPGRVHSWGSSPVWSLWRGEGPSRQIKWTLLCWKQRVQ